MGPKNKQLAGLKNKTLPGPDRDPEKLKAPGLGPGPMEKGITGTKNTWSRTSLLYTMIKKYPYMTHL
jgi:hypothetical protein